MRIKHHFLISAFNRIRSLFPSLLPLIFSNSAFAQAGQNPVGGGLNWFIDQMYGVVGIAVATIAIMFVGLLCVAHILDWKRLVQTVIGIAMVFGAGPLVQLIHDAVTR